MSAITFTNEDPAELKISEEMWKKCENEELCDVVLIVGNEDKRIPAHRSVLSETSAYFKGMFTSSLRESTSKVVRMLDVNGDVLQSLIEYCYKGSVLINEERVLELFTTAHMLFLLDVVTACAKFLIEQLHPSNSLGFMLLADCYNCELLLQKSKIYCLDNFMDVCGMHEFLQLSVEPLSQLLTCDDLHVPTEEDVFNSLKTWLEHDPIEREQHKVELLKLLRMQFVELDFLNNNIKPICTTIEAEQFFMEALECHHPTTHSLGHPSTKPRKSYEMLMVLSPDLEVNKLFLYYYCTRQCKWMKCRVEFEYRSFYSTVIYKNCLYLMGGRGGRGGRNILNTVICLNLKTMTLNELTPMIEPRENCGAAVLNGCLYAVGGHNEKKFTSSVEKFNPEINAWVKVASMSTERCFVRAGVLNKKIYAVGGLSEYGNVVLNTAECYDPVQDVWQNIASMSQISELTELMVSDGLLYAMGDSSAYQNTVERYDPQSNEWTFVCSLCKKKPRSCTILHDKIVIFVRDHFEEYDAVTDEWKKLELAKRRPCINQIFSYSGKLLKSEFVELPSKKCTPYVSKFRKLS